MSESEGCVDTVRGGMGKECGVKFRYFPPTQSSGSCRCCYFVYGGKEKIKTTVLFTDLDTAAVCVAEVVVVYVYCSTGVSNLLAKK